MDHGLEPCDSLEALGFGQVDVPTASDLLAEQGERRLLTALLEEAALTYKAHALSETRRGKRMFREAAAWFEGLESEVPLSFAYVCDVLDIDPASFRARLESWRAEAVTSSFEPAAVVKISSDKRNGGAQAAEDISTGTTGERLNVLSAGLQQGTADRLISLWRGAKGRPATNIEERSKRTVQGQNLDAVARSTVTELRRDMKEVKTMKSTKVLGMSSRKQSEPEIVKRSLKLGKQTRAKRQFADDGLLLLGYLEMFPDGIHGYHLSKMLSQDPLQLPALTLGRLYRVLRHLERGGLLTSRVEADGGRLRYRFTVTPKGKLRFRQWLASSPKGTEASSRQLLRRLRFASLLSKDELSRLFDDAEGACRASLEELDRRASPHTGPGREASQLYVSAQKEQLQNELRWLAKTRALAIHQVGEEDRENESVATTAVA